MQGLRGKLFKWTPSQNHAIVEIVDTLVETNSDVLKRDLFKIALELFNEQFGTNRTPVAFKNHYYNLVRDTKEEIVQEEVHVEEEVEQIILKEETADIVSYIEGIVNSYEKIRDENKQMVEEIASLKLKLENKDRQMADSLGDYDALLRVIERARTIIVDEETGTQLKSSVFKMEKNGNLVSA